MAAFPFSLSLSPILSPLSILPLRQILSFNSEREGDELDLFTASEEFYDPDRGGFFLTFDVSLKNLGFKTGAGHSRRDVGAQSPAPTTYQTDSKITPKGSKCVDFFCPLL